MLGMKKSHLTTLHLQNCISQMDFMGALASTTSACSVSELLAESKGTNVIYAGEIV